MIKRINLLRSKDKKNHIIEIKFDKPTEVTDFIKVLSAACEDFLTNPENLEKLLIEDDLNTDLH